VKPMEQPRPGQTILPRKRCWPGWPWALLLGLLAIAVKGQWLVAIDRGMSRWAQATRSSGLDELAKGLTFFGSSPWILILMGCMSCWWWTQRSGGATARSHRAPHRALAIFWGAWLIGVGIQSLLRLWVAQWRPETAVMPVATTLISRYELAGFPSGHAFRSAFLYGWWAGWCGARRTSWSLWARAVCLALVILVGWTRIYLNRHWFTDILGAWWLALCVLAVARFLWRRWMLA
jgi:undecaprenyl-diphosphatase